MERTMEKLTEVLELDSDLVGPQEYYFLCRCAERLGVDTSLDTNAKIDTVAKLQSAVLFALDRGATL